VTHIEFNLSLTTLDHGESKDEEEKQERRGR
jgi:hypothetical protein